MMWEWTMCFSTFVTVDWTVLYVSSRIGTNRFVGWVVMELLRTLLDVCLNKNYNSRSFISRFYDNVIIVAKRGILPVLDYCLSKNSNFIKECLKSWCNLSFPIYFPIRITRLASCCTYYIFDNLREIIQSLIAYLAYLTKCFFRPPSDILNLIGTCAFPDSWSLGKPWFLLY